MSPRQFIFQRIENTTFSLWKDQVFLNLKRYHLQHKIANVGCCRGKLNWVSNLPYDKRLMGWKPTFYPLAKRAEGVHRIKYLENNPPSHESVTKNIFANLATFPQELLMKTNCQYKRCGHRNFSDEASGPLMSALFVCNGGVLFIKISLGPYKSLSIPKATSA